MIYISGRISAPTREEELENMGVFNRKAKELRAKGLEVFNPAELEEKEVKSWEYYLARDLKWIFENKPKMYMLKKWETSRGARLEFELAKLLSLEIEYE